MYYTGQNSFRSTLPPRQRSVEQGVQATSEPQHHILTLVEQLYYGDTKPQSTPPQNVCSNLIGRVILCWSGGKSPTQLEQQRIKKDIQQCRSQRAAASQLLDEIEEKVVEVEKTLDDKTTRRTQLTNILGRSAVHGGCCQAETDENEIVIPVAHSGIIEIRPVLRSRLEATEAELADAQNQLREARRELAILSRAGQSRPHNHSYVDTDKDIKLRLIRKMAANFSKSRDALLRLTFLTWQQMHRQIRYTDALLKKSALLFVSSTRKGLLTIVWSCWHGLVRARVARQAQKNELIIKRFGMRFMMMADKSIKELFFREWCTLMQTNKLASAMERKANKADALEGVHQHTQQLNQNKSDKLLTSEKPQARKDGPCCILM